MEDLCTSQNTSCPIDIFTGEPMSTCSNFISTDHNGTICRRWVQENPNLADDAKLEYCRNNDSPECECINRNNNPIYREITRVEPALDDSCWHLPCANPSKWLVMSDMLNQPCQEDTCLRVNHAFYNRDLRLDRDQVQRYTICPIHESLGESAASSRIPIEELLVLSTPLRPGRTWTNIRVILFLSLIVLIIIIIFFMVITRRQNDTIIVL